MVSKKRGGVVDAKIRPRDTNLPSEEKLGK